MGEKFDFIFKRPDGQPSLGSDIRNRNGLDEYCGQILCSYEGFTYGTKKRGPEGDYIGAVCRGAFRKNGNGLISH